MKLKRLSERPITDAFADDFVERDLRNLNGPSLVRAPDWLRAPLGKYYLYFAHHLGSYIRSAYSDDLDGEWTLPPSGDPAYRSDLF